MSKTVTIGHRERLSTFQAWVLERIYNETAISKQGLKAFYKKARSDTKGPGQTFHEFQCGLPLTTSERVTIYRSLKNMLQKKLIYAGKYGSFYLTEKGFNAYVNANKSHASGKNVSFKDHEKKRDKHLARFEQWLDEGKALAKTLKGKPRHKGGKKK